jgi:hypothetical protein
MTNDIDDAAPVHAPPTNLRDALALAEEAIAVTSGHPLGLVKTRQLGEITRALVAELKMLEAGKVAKGNSLRRSTSGQSDLSLLILAACDHQSSVLGRSYQLGDLARALNLSPSMLSPSKLNKLTAVKIEDIRALAGYDPSK